ncbi:MAG TPA: hypothetical protein VF976_02775 [Gemmatimonadales bacterium]
MCHYTSRTAALALVVGALACSDRPPGTAPEAASGEPATLSAAARPELLARSLALALGDPAFRAHVKHELDRSPFREHKLSFQRFLVAERGSGSGALAAMARGTGLAAADLARAAERAIPLEMYLPVPEHRRAWTGDANVLVATAIADHDPPVAFDLQGNRRVLDPERPPATPVIAVVPVETDFAAAPAAIGCLSCGFFPWPPPPPPVPPALPGLYMTKAHFVDDFEGWLKGGPEFEVHILGQNGQTDSLTDYQCAGEKQAAPYYFDQNALDWSGSVMLLSKVQLDAYNAAHPGQNIRVFVVEDDDTACEIKANRDIVGNLFKAVDGAYKALTAGNDSSSLAQKTFKRASAFQKLWAALASLFNTNDELVGNAVEDVVAGISYPGYNWIVKGQGNATNGWLTLNMK